MREPIQLKRSWAQFKRGVLLFQIGGAIEGRIPIEVRIIDDRKVEKFQDALDVVGRIYGIHPQQLIKRLEEIGLTFSKKTWQRIVGVIWLPADCLASEDGEDGWMEWPPWANIPAEEGKSD